MPVYRVPYRGDEMRFDLPRPADLVEAVAPASAMALRVSISPAELRGIQQVLVVFTDATRHSPDQWFAEQILAALPKDFSRVRFLCATGMHRPSTHAEKLAKLGAAIVQRYEVLDHDAAAAVSIGEIDGIPVEVNPLLLEPATLIICMGVVEPHQYAGYSGGLKTAVIGCGGPNTIARTHGPAMLDQAGVRLGLIGENPFQQFVRRAGALIGVDYILNAVMPAPEQIAYALFGRISVHDELVAYARRLYEVPVRGAPYDVVIAGVDSPKDVNLYQASRAATYLALAERPVLRDGGVIIVPAWLPEGAGEGQGEKNFFAALTRYGAGQRLLKVLRSQGCQPGEQRAYMIAQMLQRYHCIFVGARNPIIVRAAGLRYAPDMPDALRQAALLSGVDAPRVLVVPHALRTLPKPL